MWLVLEVGLGSLVGSALLLYSCGPLGTPAAVHAFCVRVRAPIEQVVDPWFYMA